MFCHASRCVNRSHRGQCSACQDCGTAGLDEVGRLSSSCMTKADGTHHLDAGGQERMRRPLLPVTVTHAAAPPAPCMSLDEQGMDCRLPIAISCFTQTQPWPQLPCAAASWWPSAGLAAAAVGWLPSRPCRMHAAVSTAAAVKVALYLMRCGGMLWLVCRLWLLPRVQ